MRWWAAKGTARCNDERIEVSRRALDDAQLSFAWDTEERFHADGVGQKMLKLASVLAHPGSATSGSTSSWPKVRSTSSIRLCPCGMSRR